MIQDTVIIWKIYKISFKVALFKVRWYKLLLQGDERIANDHDNGFTMINTTRYESSIEPYILLSKDE
jgi:hypothetical protein